MRKARYRKVESLAHSSANQWKRAGSTSPELEITKIERQRGGQGLNEKEVEGQRDSMSKGPKALKWKRAWCV